jgi:integrase
MPHGDGVYSRKNRKGLWTWWRDAQGRRRWRKVKVATVYEARSVRAAEQARAERARVLGFNPPGQEIFKDVASRFLIHQRARITAAAYDREHGIVQQHLCRFFNAPIAAIRRIDVQRYVTRRSGEVSADTVRKELNSLKHLLRLAMEWEIIPTNPAQGVKAPKAPAGRTRYLQPEELKAVLDTAPVWLRPIIGLLAATGMRRSELLGTRWVDVDLANSIIHLRQTKNGDARPVYLNELALTVLRSLPGSDGHQPTSLFPGITPEQVSMAFRRTCRKLGIADCRLHDLRHTAASHMRLQGHGIDVIADLLGHRDLRMAKRYQHLSPQFLHSAVRSLDAVYGNWCYPGVTEPKVLPEAIEITCSKSWRPRRDLNPCYRRERAMS